jgi:Stigma-specific protein, Stig1
MKLRFVFGWLCAGAGAGAAIGCLGAAFNEGSGGGTSSASSSAGSSGAAGSGVTSTSHASSSAGASSSSGTVVCAPSKTACSDKCFDLQVDPEHCGGCDVTCDTTELCSAGGCKCRPGFSSCPGPAGGAATICADWQHDPRHCGSCSIACKPTEVCVPAMGTTPAMCSPEPCPGSDGTNCDGGCYQSLDSTQLDCGACGNACQNTEVCANGACETAYVVQSCVACAVGTKCCPTGGLNFCVPLTGPCPSY